METLWNELSAGFADPQHLIVILIRLIASALLGAAIGFERERAGKKAGLRTHMLVSTGTTVFVLAGLNSGMPHDAISRVIQGIITGIGFVGAGSILKSEGDRKIEGVTTSAAIWMAAAIGVSVGLGGLGLAILATALSLVVLRITYWFENRVTKTKRSPNASS
jgi:putative Mg2+ transporter-C (MgtC) family protein